MINEWRAGTTARHSLTLEAVARRRAALSSRPANVNLKRFPRAEYLPERRAATLEIPAANSMLDPRTTRIFPCGLRHAPRLVACLLLACICCAPALTASAITFAQATRKRPAARPVAATPPADAPARRPAPADALLREAAALLQSGKLAEAEAAARQAVSVA
ncbi:MAG TPA: hypothetical protein VEZ40_03690, partial [Pyrinomonadaceae bacterium]|nr:hypothetical protein [Pyrinomonadaceae bacterium]